MTQDCERLPDVYRPSIALLVKMSASLVRQETAQAYVFFIHRHPWTGDQDMQRHLELKKGYCLGSSMQRTLFQPESMARLSVGRMKRGSHFQPIKRCGYA